LRFITCERAPIPLQILNTATLISNVNLKGNENQNTPSPDFPDHIVRDSITGFGPDYHNRPRR